MAAAWEGSGGQSLARRMLLCLEAAEARGGDLRGRQSAALRVHSPVDGDWWEGVNIDLRVDDNPEPLVEMRRLLTIREAYTAAEFAEAADARGSNSEAAELYEQAGEALPYSAELAFWQGVSLVRNGRSDEAAVQLKAVIGLDPKWAELLRRLVRSGQLQCDPHWLATLLG
jgi:uncharacterized Ntn-hydrolase superfamily protein